MTVVPVTVRARLTLWHAVIMMLILSIFALGTYTFVRENLFAQIDARLDSNLALAIKVARADLVRLPELEQNTLIFALRVLEEDDWPLYESSGWLAADLDTKAPAPHNSRWIVAPERRGNFHLQPESGGIYHLKEEAVVIGHKKLRFTTAVQSEQIHRSLDRLGYTLLGGLPAALLLSLLGGYFIAGRILNPLQRITQRARTISADNLSERLLVTNPIDELGQLSALLNDAFARLEDSFDRLKRFTQDAAHEFRTPLAVIRGVGEVSLQEQRDGPAYREVIGSMLEEVDRMGRLVDGLLMLARGESGRFLSTRKPENLESLIVDVVECLRVLAEEKQQQLTLHNESALVAEIDRDTMYLALINLIANAIRYTQHGGTITIALRMSGAAAVIEVQDNGPGISSEHHPHIFERFYRVDASRSHHTGGTGLGLAITRWAVESNSGCVELHSTPGEGCLFRITLQLSKYQ